MGLEIERRFIVQGEEWKAFSQNAQELKQGYLSNNFEEWIVRVRIINEIKSEITLKALAEGISNYEFEYPIPFQDSLSIWNLITKKLTKTRYFLDVYSKKWIVDCFHEDNFPLVIAELELNSEQEHIEQPSWCSYEITGIKEFSNAALAELPIKTWSAKKRKRFNLP